VLRSLELFLFKEAKEFELFLEIVKSELEVAEFKITKSLELFMIDNKIVLEYS
jgi:hypothetical protein